MSEPRWVTSEQVITLNQSILEGTLEHHLLRDLGALESALARPQNYFAYTGDASVSMLVAEVVFGVGKAHAFEQGNKRTAWAAGRLMAYLNGFHIEVPRGGSQMGVAMVVEKAVTEDPYPGLLSIFIEPFLRPRT